MPTITIDGTDYDINKDFTWAELIEVEEKGGQPLGRDGSLDSLATIGAFFYVVKRRANAALTWEAFLAEPMPDMASEEPVAKAKPKPKARPT